jgi:hypothetical protein
MGEPQQRATRIGKLHATTHAERSKNRASARLQTFPKELAAQKFTKKF